MIIPPSANSTAAGIARAMIDGFDRHYRLIRQYGQQAKALFESGDWRGVQQAVRERISSYDSQASETARMLATDFGATDIVSERGDAGVARVKELTPAASGTAGGGIRIREIIPR